MAATTRSRIARLAVPSLAATALAAGALSVPAHAADQPVPGKVTASFDINGSGLDRVVPHPDGTRRSAGNFKLKLADGTPVYVFCVDFLKDVEKKGSYTAGGWSTSSLSADVLGQVSYIAANHTKVGTKYPEATWENAAAQVAIWELTNPTKVEADDLGNTKFAQRVDALVAAAQKNKAAEPVLDFALEGSKTVKTVAGKSVNVIAGKVTETDGDPVANAPVTFVVDGVKQAATTDVSGVARVEVESTDKARTVAMQFTGTVAPGVVFVPDSGLQPMVSSTPFTVSREMSLRVAAAAPVVEEESPKEPEGTPKPEPTATPAPEPEPKVEPAPEPKVNDVPKVLPKTGGPVGLVAMIAAAIGVLAAGIKGIRFFRRK